MILNFRDLFHIPKNQKTKQELTYLCGHSLGLQPKAIRDAIENELNIWQDFAVDGHFKQGSPWYSYHENLALPLAKLIGAEPTEVVAMNSLTTNLHLMMVSFFQPTKAKYKILTDSPCFPSDKYALDSILKFHGLDPADALIKIETIEGESLINTQKFLSKIKEHKEKACLVFLNPVNYLSGQFMDIEVIAAACQQHGLTIGLDLAHSIGNVPLKLHEWQIDFAIWCSYKYLNGGPGTIGGCFVHSNHHQQDLRRFEGWWGTNNKTRFLMKNTFESAFTADAWQLSNPPILLLAALKASLEIFDQTTINKLNEQSSLLTSLFIDAVEKCRLKEHINIINAETNRGNMISLRLKNSNHFSEVQEKLTKAGIVIDYRQPDILRASFSPLYNTQADVHAFLNALDYALNCNEMPSKIQASC